jgi:putative inorganic carbon (HCO3(-)) transporter
MRDVVILAIILGSVPICFFKPYFGVLMWTWIAYFSPHRYAFSPTVYYFPVAEVIALPTLAGLIFTRDMNRRIFTREMVVMFLLWIWLGITLIYAANVPAFAGHIDAGESILGRISKILLMTVVMVLLVNSHKKMKYLYLVTALSFGFLALKGTLFGLRTGGTSRVWGPPDSFITDNNDMALAMNMSLPILFFLAQDTENRMVRNFLRVLFVAGIICVVLTYSRGGLLGLATVLAIIAVKSKKKLIAGVMLFACIVLVISFAPQQWMARMQTISQGVQDETAHERVIAWGFAWNLVKDYPITGGGLEAFPDVALFQAYTPEPLPNGYQASSAHSIYFQVLGEAGFVGLGLFLLLLGFALASTRRIRKLSRHMPALNWMKPYADMVETGLLGFMVSGAFLSRPYFDFFFQFVASVVIMKILCKREVVQRIRAVQAIDAGAAEGELVTT